MDGVRDNHGVFRLGSAGRSARRGGRPRARRSCRRRRWRRHRAAAQPGGPPVRCDDRSGTQTRPAGRGEQSKALNTRERGSRTSALVSVRARVERRRRPVTSLAPLVGNQRRYARLSTPHDSAELSTFLAASWLDFERPVSLSDSRNSLWMCGSANSGSGSSPNTCPWGLSGRPAARGCGCCMPAGSRRSCSELGWAPRHGAASPP
jgi:hypothetical protein